MTEGRAGAAPDAVNTEIFANLFRAIVNEMGWIIQRSAHTTFVKETLDFGAALVTPEGEQFAVVDATGVTALLGVNMAPGVAAFADWAPGDVAVTNDPYATAGMVTHLNDVFFLKPLFSEGELICFAWAFVHCSDVGGNVPGSIDGVNYEVFQEGLRIPPTKLHRQGALNQELVDLISNNCRSPEMNWGDLNAAVSSLNRAETRLAQLIARYDRGIVQSAMHRTLERAEAVTRNVLKQLPAGSYEFDEYLEDNYVNAVPVRAQLRLTARGDGTVELDFSGSDAQVGSAINLPAGGQRHHPMLSLALINFVVTQTEGQVFNAGILRCIDLKLPEHSFVNASFPAACGMRVVTSMRVHDMALGALAAAMPGRVPAGGAGQLAVISIATADLAGKTRVVAANAVVGGSGGGGGLDGISATDFPTAALRNIPVEVLEAEAPVRVRRFALRPDSEGAGEQRGGFGVEYAFELTDHRARVVTRGKDRHKFAAWGVAGGRAAEPSFSRMEQADGALVEVGKRAVQQPHLGDLMVVAGGGGGGYGSPLARDAELVRRDILDELISPARGRSEYGVALAADGVLDVEATAALRRRLAQERTANGPFDFGPGRSAWQRDWREAYGIVAGWCRKLPPNGRRLAQERAYLRIVERLPPPPAAADVLALLEQLEREWA